MTITSAVLAGRRAALARMTDTCRIGPWTRSAEPDPDTLEYTYELSPVVYEGPCELTIASRVRAQPVDAAGQLLVNQLLEVRLPIEGTEGVLKGMRVIFDSSQLDNAIVGTHATIEAPFRAEHVTARRLPVILVS